MLGLKTESSPPCCDVTDIIMAPNEKLGALRHVVTSHDFLCRLREQEEEKLRHAESQATSQTEAASGRRGTGASGAAGLTSVNEEEEEIDSRIAKLIEERDTLLQTGVYTTEDRIIMELDRQIRAAIASKG